MEDNELTAEFALSENNLSPIFELSRADSFDVMFKIESNFEIIGEGLINAALENGKAVITSESYTFEQGFASDVWQINHNLNKYPSVILVDSAGTKFEAQIEYNDKNNCTVYMNGATTGKAYLN